MTVDVVDRQTGSLERVPLSIDAQKGSVEVLLELAPGASSVQFVARENSHIAAAIEVPAQAGEQVAIELRRDADGGFRALSRNRDFLVLPSEEPEKPLLLKPPQTDQLDVVILVDGTCLHPRRVEARPPDLGVSSLEYLLSPIMSSQWGEIVNSLTDLIARISKKYSSLWTLAAAFGDEPMPLISNAVISPSYIIHPAPEARRLAPATLAQLSQNLRRLPPSPGGDFVDALADGLKACASVGWRQSSRKLVVLFGHSPGYSVLDPSDEMASLLIRKACIEEEIAALHQRGVEVITIFHQPPEADEMYTVYVAGMFERARNQYARLATMSMWSSVSPGIDAESIANSWLNAPPSIARGACPGLLAAAT